MGNILSLEALKNTLDEKLVRCNFKAKYDKKYHKFFNVGYQLKLWSKFFATFSNYGKTLDFGCGCGWSILVAKHLGIEIEGLDIKTRVQTFNDVSNILGTYNLIKFYLDQINILLPFNNCQFDSIIARSSINKGLGKRTAQYTKNCELRVTEFERVSKENAIWYIAPFTHSNLANKYKKRTDITIIGWSGHLDLKYNRYKQKD